MEYYLLSKNCPHRAPRERLKHTVLPHYPTASCPAIILRTGALQRAVLNLSARYSQVAASPAGPAVSVNLFQERGWGSKGIPAKAALELGRRADITHRERLVVKSPADIATCCSGDELLEQEELRLVLLNTKNQVLAVPAFTR